MKPLTREKPSAEETLIVRMNGRSHSTPAHVTDLLQENEARVNRATAAPKLCTTCGTRYAADALFCPSDGTPLSSGPSAEAARAGSGDVPDAYLGREISGHIEIRQLAGVGAMGRVYRAFQKGIDRDVAVKVLHRELSANAQLVQRFHREAKVASRLQHPNVVQVHLAGQLPDGALYIVMEYLDGLSLQSALAAAGGAMPLPRALRLAVQLCDAVGEAHAQGVVHRDLKPENVMLVRRGDDPDTIKVLDFGIARLNWGEQSMATAAGLIFGTARYISPEGAQGEIVGPMGDVYSIATLLFQMLSGRTPFEGDQAVALLIAQIHDPPPHLRSIPRAAYVPAAIADLVMKNLAKDPSARDPDARAFGRALLEAAQAGGMSVDDLVARSGLLTKSSGPIQLAPMQATKQLQLNPEMEALLAGAPRPSNSSSSLAQATSYETPAGVAHDVAAVTAGAPTTKWTPPPGFQAQLSAARATQPSGVDATLDDEPAPIAFPAPSAPRGGTLMTPTPLPAFVPSLPSSSPRSQIDTGRLDTEPPRSNVETTLNGEEGVAQRRGRGALFFLVCFFIAVGTTTGVLYKMGRIGQSSSSASALESTVQRAQDALRQKRWDQPPDDNVRDLTTDGLEKWPGEERLKHVRERAADSLVREAPARERAGDVREALRLVELAKELDPTDEDAQTLVEKYEALVRQLATPTALPAPSAATPSVPPTASHGRPPPAAPLPIRATLEALPAKPRVGQQIELTVRIAMPGGAAPKANVEEPHFVIAGGPAGSSGTKMLALTESPGVYRGTFSFLEPGRYEISFNGKADGVPVHVSKTVIAGDVPRAPHAPPPGVDPPTPPPSPSGKWL